MFWLGYSLAEIKVRGRWKSLESVERYSKVEALVRGNEKLAPWLLEIGQSLISDPDALATSIMTAITDAPVSQRRRKHHKGDGAAPPWVGVKCVPK